MKLSCMKGIGLVGLTSLLSFGAHAGTRANDGLASEQVSYLTTLMDNVGLLLIGIMFVVSLVIIAVSSFVVIKKGILAKNEMDEEFKLGGWVIALVVAAVLAYPTGAYMIGQDLFSGEQQAVEIGDFQNRD